MMPDLKKVKSFCLLKRADRKVRRKSALADKYYVAGVQKKRAGSSSLLEAPRANLRQQINTTCGRAEKTSREFFPARSAARKSALADKYYVRACRKKAYVHRKFSGAHTRKNPPGILGNGSTSDYFSRSSVLAVDPLS